jgi:hypothetical protein
VNNNRGKNSVKGNFRNYFATHDENGGYGFKCGINGLKMKNNVTAGGSTLNSRYRATHETRELPPLLHRWFAYQSFLNPWKL